MNIRINALYTLANDESNIILMKDAGKKDKKGRAIRESVGFYSTIEDALNGYARLKIMASEASTMVELLAEVRSIKQEIRDLIAAETKNDK